MPVTISYTDAYLKTRVTVDIENRAMAEIDAIRAFPTAPVNYRESLIRLRAYIITCLEQGSTSDDVFAAKLTAYRKEYDAALAAAHAAANKVDTTGNKVALYSISLERA